jgi:hypothetical protein
VIAFLLLLLLLTIESVVHYASASLSESSPVLKPAYFGSACVSEWFGVLGALLLGSTNSLLTYLSVMNARRVALTQIVRVN